MLPVLRLLLHGFKVIEKIKKLKKQRFYGLSARDTAEQAYRSIGQRRAVLKPDDGTDRRYDCPACFVSGAAQPATVAFIDYDCFAI